MSETSGAVASSGGAAATESGRTGRAVATPRGTPYESGAQPPARARVDLVLRSTRVVTPAGVRPATVHVADGRIAEVLPHATPAPAGARQVELGNDALLPGLADTQVHVNDPGRTHWEGFASATRAAAAGGVTTLVDMPLNSVPHTTTVPHLARKRAVAGPKVLVGRGLLGRRRARQPGRTARPARGRGLRLQGLPLAVGRGRVPAPDSKPARRRVGRADRRRRVAARARAGPTPPRERPARQRPALCRLPRLAAAVRRGRGYRHADRGGPGQRRPGAPVAPFVRRGAADDRCGARRRPPDQRRDLPALPDPGGGGSAGRRDGVQVLPAHQGGRQPGPAVAGPARERHRLRRLRPLAEHPRAEDGRLRHGLGRHLLTPTGPARPVWSAARARGHDLADVARWMSTAPAALAGLTAKGAIAPGRDADFAVLAPERTFTVDAARLHHRNRVTAYAGRTLRGVVRSTWLRGQRIARDGQPTAPAGGRLLTRR